MHIPLWWRMVTGTFTSRIMWNCSKRCTKTWEIHLWCGAPRISSDQLCSITKPQVPPRKAGTTSHKVTQPHWLPGHKSPLPGKSSWSYSVCHQGERRQTGISGGRMGHIAFQLRKRSPSQNPAEPKVVEEPQAADILMRCCFLFAWDRCFLCCDQANSCSPGTWLSAGPPVNQSMSTPDQPRAAPAVTRS